MSAETSFLDVAQANEEETLQMGVLQQSSEESLFPSNIPGKMGQCY